jgi:hypothetical protein
MGGRNIADEYFARSLTSNFVDMDVLVVGGVMPRLRSIFDAYWNSQQAYPVETIVAASGDPVDLRRAFNHLVEDGEQMTSIPVPMIDMLGHRPLGRDLDAGHLHSYGALRSHSPIGRIRSQPRHRCCEERADEYHGSRQHLGAKRRDLVALFHRLLGVQVS